MDNFDVSNFTKAYINDTQVSSGNLTPKFLFNDFSEKKHVYTTIIDNLDGCDEFLFSVAFINYSGLALIKSTLNDLARKGIKGRIITTNYLAFSDPKAIRELEAMPNVEVRMYMSGNAEPGFHTKGYIFRYQDTYKAIIGSSNLTVAALKTNKEWNHEIVSKKDGLIIKEILNEFNKSWEKAKPIEEIIDGYEKIYFENLAKKTSILEEGFDGTITDDNILKPNVMQVAFTNQLNNVIKSGEKRGLLIAATGTGKTFASAFGIRDIESLKPKRALFITHRETILKQAKNAYKKVFGKEYTYGMFTGNLRGNRSENFIFATFSLLIKDEHLQKFKPDEFDIVIIDEVHRVGDNKYQKIINYFKPKFLLGMSATPDRTDGYDLYKLFDHNILYEIRLLDALDAKMLCPFQYYGVSDISVDGKPIEDKSDFLNLTDETRLENIITKIKYYGYSGKRAKGLIFVNSIEVGESLSSSFNQNGYKTIFLSGKNSQTERDKAIEQLAKDDISGGDYLDYIFSVDIFNEGVDIPEVNQVVLLRPTESVIVFLQQLGRGLRLNKDKEFVTIIDFIGNYENNYYILTALSDHIKSRQEITKKIREPLPGESVIHFEEIARERIFASVSKAVVNSKREIYNQYIDTKNKYNRIPSLVEFEKNGYTSARVFMDLPGYKSYPEFLMQKDDFDKSLLNDKELRMLEVLSKYVAPGKRIHETILLETLVNGGGMNEFKDELKKYRLNLTNEIITSIVGVLTGTFYSNENEKVVEFCIYNGREFELSDDFKKALSNKNFIQFLNYIFEYAHASNDDNYCAPIDYITALHPFETYTRRDVCHLTNHKRNEESTLYGYKYLKAQKVLPIFISYHKFLEDHDTVNYEDEFLDPSTLIWYTRHPRTLKSGEILDIIEASKDPNFKLLLFVQRTNTKDSTKSKKDNDFFFLGRCDFLNSSWEDTKMLNGENVVRVTIKLREPIRNDIYEYLVKTF